MKRGTTTVGHAGRLWNRATHPLPNPMKQLHWYTVTLGAILLAATPTTLAAKGHKGKAANLAALPAVLAEFDLDHDGKLAKTEKRAIHKSFKTNPDGPLKVLDTNSDGKISNAEIKGVTKAKHQGKNKANKAGKAKANKAGKGKANKAGKANKGGKGKANRGKKGKAERKDPAKEQQPGQ